MDDTLIISIYDGGWKFSVMRKGRICEKSKSKRSCALIRDLWNLYKACEYPEPYASAVAERGGDIVKGVKTVIVCEDGTITTAEVKEEKR